MDDNGVVFKGTVNGLTILLKDDTDFDEVFGQIKKKIASAGKFFSGATLSVKYKGRKLSKEQEGMILDFMSKNSGAEIKSFEEDSEEYAANSGSDFQFASSGRHDIKRFYHFKGLSEGISKFYRGTVRSGQLINFDGNLIIIGDVNPGGEVIATGNVVVMGSLRGMVHAGADGNKEAIVAALNLHPTQLRIAGVITRSPDEKGVRNQFVPELAYIKDDSVYIEHFLPQR